MKKLFQSIIFFLFLLLLLGGGYLLYLSQGLPDPSNFSHRVVAQSTKIYDRTGKILLYEIHKGEKRRVLSQKEDISPYVFATTLAAEDHTFYQHHGFVIKSIFRALIHNLLHPHDLQGGSTITQQLARNAFLTLDKSLNRKLKEAILTIEIEKRYSKDEILLMYLNQVHYGHNVYGIEAAAEFYFNKPARDLSLAESAYLAALLKAPNYLSPYGNHRQELEQRKNWILRRLQELHYYPPSVIQKAMAQKVVFAVPSFGIKAPHFVMYVRDQLYKQFGKEELEEGGYTVITTLDMRLQNLAEELVHKYGDFNEKKIGAQNMALLAEDPHTGQILAMVGSRDYWNTEKEGNVNAALSIRQPGSTFKPIVYAAAFLKGYTPETVIFDTALDGVRANFSTDPQHPYEVTNYDNKTRGPVTFREALAQSLNIPSVKVLYLTGIDKAIALAQKMGITTLTEPPSHYGLSLILGGGGVKLNEMVNAYSVFAQDGIYHPQVAILKIINSQGKVIYQYQPSSKKILPPQIARMITDILSDNTSRAPTFGWHSPLYFPQHQIAAKTGTDSEYRDAWTLGFSTNLVAGVWVGNNDRSPVSPQGAPGVMLAAPCWHEFMEKSFQFYPPGNFIKPLPSNLPSRPMLNGKYINLRKYINPNNNDTQVIPEIHSILYYVNKDDPLGPCPVNPSSDPQFWNWEIPVLLWAQKNIPDFPLKYNKIISPEYRAEDCQSSNDFIQLPPLPIIQFIQPHLGEYISGDYKLKVKVSSPAGIKEVKISLNQDLLTPISQDNDIYSVTLPYNKLQEQNKIVVEVEDKLGQQSNSSLIIFKR